MKKWEKSRKRRKKPVKRMIIGLLLVAIFTVQVMEVLAESNEPSVVVSNYSQLYTAVMNASDGDTIGIDSVMSINGTDAAESGLGDVEKHITIVRMNKNACIQVNVGNMSFMNISFDGNGIQATSPLIAVNSPTVFRDCSFNDCESINFGAAVQASGASSEFVDCSFEGNKAEQAGAVSVGNGSVTNIRNCTFKGNEATMEGGAISVISVDATLRINNSTFTGNTAPLGGAICNNGTLVMNEQTLMYDNTADAGAEILNYMGASVTVPTVEELEDAFKAINLKPLEWANDYDGTMSLPGAVNPEKEDAFMKLVYEEIQEETEPETSTEESTEPETTETEPIETEASTEASTEKSSSTPSEVPEEPSQDDQETPSDTSKEESSTSGNETPSEANKDASTTPSSNSGASNDSPSSSTSGNSSGTGSSGSTSTTTNNNSTSKTETDKSQTTTNTTNNYYYTADAAGSTQGNTSSGAVESSMVLGANRTTTPSGSTSAKAESTSNTSGEEISTEAQKTQNEASESLPGNINIDAKGVDVTFSVVDGVYSININSNDSDYTEIQDVQTPLGDSISNESSVNWYEIIKIILLAAIAVCLVWKEKPFNIGHKRRHEQG